MKYTFKKLICFVIIFSVSLTTTGYQMSIAAAKYSKLKVHYIDVGESDCVLIQSNGKNMLIDAGNNGDGDTIVNYLKENKVKKLDYIICTHPHADHIGGMDDVIREYKVSYVIMPTITNNSKAFEELIDMIKDKKLKTIKPEVGKEYTIGKAEFTIIAPNNNDYGSNTNEYSVGIKLINGLTSFIFIGDCESKAINDILCNGIDIDADVYMCGHHGSNTSTTKELLEAVSPDYAVISVGKNKYGHPSEETFTLLKDDKIDTYRTDEKGTIIAISTGKDITMETLAR